MTEIICTFITASTAIIVAVLTSQIKKSENLSEQRAKEAEQRAKEAEQRAELRKRESLLSMRMNFANLSLGMTTSLALTGGHTNGNVEAAQEAAQEAAREYEEFVQEQGFEKIIKS